MKIVFSAWLFLFASKTIIHTSSALPHQNYGRKSPPSPFSYSSGSRVKMGFHFLVGQSREGVRVNASTAWRTKPNTLLRVHFSNYVLNTYPVAGTMQGREQRRHRVERGEVLLGHPDPALLENGRAQKCSSKKAEAFIVESRMPFGQRWTTRKAVQRRLKYFMVILFSIQIIHHELIKNILCTNTV